jgi:hypothetical protein
LIELRAGHIDGVGDIGDLIGGGAFAAFDLLLAVLFHSLLEVCGAAADTGRRGFVGGFIHDVAPLKIIARGPQFNREAAARVPLNQLAARIFLRLF